MNGVGNLCKLVQWQCVGCLVVVGQYVAFAIDDYEESIIIQWC